MNDDGDDEHQQRQKQRWRVGVALVGALIVALVVGKLYMNAPREEHERRRLVERREVLRQMLARVSNILRQSQISHWLVFGTLKGWHEGRRIPATAYEVEMGVVAQQVPLLTSALLNSLPSDEYLVIPASPVMGTLIVHRGTGLLLELTSYADTGDGILRQTSPCTQLRSFQCHTQRDFPAAFIFPLYSDMLDGVDVPIPNQPMRMLDAWYSTGESCRAQPPPVPEPMHMFTRGEDANQMTR